MKYTLKSTIALILFLLFTFMTTKVWANQHSSSDWSGFSQQIKHCKKEQFILRVNDKPYPQIFRIQGWEGQKCVLSIQDQPPKDIITTEILYCDLNQNDLDWLSEFAQMKIAERENTMKDYRVFIEKKCEMIY